MKLGRTNKRERNNREKGHGKNKKGMKQGRV
jgi:hypothetical protein